ncbi:MAG: NAD-dependent epimerase/dehydratase family protein [Candidatus Lokiarchaeota archaeon]|nr:NAD-dependent epimerase/dehydratase family protein [Candidatus Lokiarchaeota archaeon]
MPAVKSLDGPVAVTGASGYIGSHVVVALMKHGYNVHACITDLNNPEKTDHLLKLNQCDYSGQLDLFSANLLEEGSYDIPFTDCIAVLHAATPMGYGGANTPHQVYDGMLNGTKNILNSVKKVGTVKRFVYTSSFAAIHHPMPSGYIFTEKDWATDNRDNDPSWSHNRIDEDGVMAYNMAKIETELMCYDFAEKDGRFDVISACPNSVLGPVLSKVHNSVGSWQWCIGQMLMRVTCKRAWNYLWNIVDVRDVGESQVLMIESKVSKNRSRYQLCATDESGEINVLQLQALLLKLFPKVNVGGPPDEIHAIINKYGNVYQTPLAHCDKARKELGLETHSVEDTLRETGQTMIDLGLVKPNWK